ncbi:phage antirepressor KilAC domain-containing protein [Nocardiopsis quinghaiensis]|uniref:phage antirepressor KilAC domain-containing protein n=1 Tax=Nocardiopsis quinghaiensis TaxID=464995 RepID=UPI001CC2555F|nr:phage antirepressor KilAC domain-containing protein [Nocardiopsis quinghaiensis]
MRHTEHGPDEWGGQVRGPFQDRRAAVEEATGRAGAPTAPTLVPSGADLDSMPSEAIESIGRLGEAISAAARRALEARASVGEPGSAAHAWNVLVSADGDYSVREAAHILNRDPAISTGQRRLFSFIRASGMVSAGTDVPKAGHERRLRLRPTSYSHPRTGRRVSAKPQLRVTAEGLRYLHQRLGGPARPAVDEAA